jgi:hypothetical protein
LKTAKNGWPGLRLRQWAASLDSSHDWRVSRGAALVL